MRFCDHLIIIIIIKHINKISFSLNYISINSISYRRTKKQRSCIVLAKASKCIPTSLKGHSSWCLLVTGGLSENTDVGSYRLLMLDLAGRSKFHSLRPAQLWPVGMMAPPVPPSLFFVNWPLGSWLTTTGRACVQDKLCRSAGNYSPSMTGKKKYYFEQLLIILSWFLFV